MAVGEHQTDVVLSRCELNGRGSLSKGPDAITLVSPGGMLMYCIKPQGLVSSLGISRCQPPLSA